MFAAQLLTLPLSSEELFTKNCNTQYAVVKFEFVENLPSFKIFIIVILYCRPRVCSLSELIQILVIKLLRDTLF